MKITIVVEDKFMSIDSVGVNFDFDVGPGIRVIQWTGSSGNIEYSDGRGNKDISDFAEFEHLIGEHTQALDSRAQALEAQELQDQEDRLDSMTWADKRRAEYPDIGDQLDALFHGSVFPEEMRILLQAVKDKYPKP
jgi:hypothetical protein